MQLQVKGRNLPVTDALHEHVERKLARIERILPPWDPPTHIDVELFVERNRSIAHRQVAEATVHTKGPVLRAREHADDMYQAIDHVIQKIERQAARYRERRKSHRDPHARERASVEAPIEISAEELAEARTPAPDVVKRKRFEMAPMSLDDAILRLELIGHPFFVFRDAESGEVAVLYRRDDGQLGLIETGEQLG